LLQLLPAELREMARLRAEGFDWPVIGERLGLTKEAARKRWSRGLPLLQDALRKHGLSPPFVQGE
jgi:hypothetical protein